MFYYSGDGAWQINISFIIAWVGTMHNIQAFSFCNYSLAPWHAVHGLSLEDIVNHLRIKKFMKMLIFYDIIGSFIVCETAKGG